MFWQNNNTTITYIWGVEYLWRLEGVTFGSKDAERLNFGKVETGRLTFGPKDTERLTFGPRDAERLAVDELGKGKEWLGVDDWH